MIAPLAADDPPLHLVVGNAHRAGGRFGRVRGGIPLQRRDNDLAGLLLADLGQLLVVAEDRGAGLLLELRIEDFQQAADGLRLAQAAQLVQRLPLHVEELRQLLLALVGLLDLLAELALGGLDDALLFADLLGLLFEGVLPLVEKALALVEFAADLAKILLALLLLLEHQLLELQFALAAAVLGLLRGLGNDLGGLALAVFPPQMVENPDQDESHRKCYDSRKNNGDNLPRRHDYVPRSARVPRAGRVAAAIAERCGAAHRSNRRRDLQKVEARLRRERTEVRLTEGNGLKSVLRTRILHKSLTIGGVCGYREAGPLTRSPRGPRVESPAWARNETRNGRHRRQRAGHPVLRVAAIRARKTPAAWPRSQGRHKPWRPTGPSSAKTVRHPIDAAEIRQFAGRRPIPQSPPGPSRNNCSTCGGPGCRQDPRSAIDQRDQPPKQNKKPVCHLFNSAHPLVLAVSSRTPRILAIHYAPALPADCPKHFQFVKKRFSLRKYEFSF